MSTTMLGAVVDPEPGCPQLAFDQNRPVASLAISGYFALQSLKELWTHKEKSFVSDFRASSFLHTYKEETRD